MKIAVLDDYQQVVKLLSCYSLIQDFDVQVFCDKFQSPNDLIHHLKGFDALVLTRERTEISASILKMLPNLKVISQTGRPGEHIDASYCTDNGIAILAGSGSPIAPAELTWALVMCAQKRLNVYMQSLLSGQWQSSKNLKNNKLNFPRSLNGKTLGIFGLGKIGSLVAKYGLAFGMDVLVYGLESSKNKAQEMGYRFAASQQQLFEQSDVLSLHLRLNKNTSEIVKLSDLESMKRDSILVNTSRSKLIEEFSIERCLQENRGPHVFALDVFEQEPLLDNLQWLDVSRVVATPHIGFVELNSFELYYQTAFRNLIEFKSGNYTSVFNSEVISKLGIS